MKSFFKAAICLFAIFTICGCAGIKTVRRPSLLFSGDPNHIPIPAYSGQKAELAVADFELKVALADEGIGTGLRMMLETALINSRRFLIAGRYGQSSAEALAAGQKTEARPGDLIISAAVTEFEPEVSGGKSGVGGGSSANSGVLGALLGGPVNKAHMTLAIRIVNAATSEVLTQIQARGQASGTISATAPDFFKDKDLPGGLSAYKDAPIEKAIRECINESVRQIVQVVPADYYKY